jgi:hypothetical protein
MFTTEEEMRPTNAAMLSLPSVCNPRFGLQRVVILKQRTFRRHNRPCAYNGTSNAVRNPGLNGSSSPGASDREDSSKPIPRPSFPGFFFVDSVLFSRSLGQLPEPSFQIDTNLQSFLGDIFVDNDFVSAYFRYIHSPIPFISKKFFMERILNPLGQAQPARTLLVASMKLVANPPAESGPQTPAYHCIKAALLQAEGACLDFRIFQALILMTLYELGHAIYPAAYLTLGYCARYGYALGIDKSIENNPAMSSAQTEEERRSWWAVILLDR